MHALSLDGLPLASGRIMVAGIFRAWASGGPAEQTFATLVGLELRPGKLREAAPLWERLTQAADPDDLDEPAGFIDRIIGGDTSGIDEAIAKREGSTDTQDPGPDGGAVDN
jgi:hypothetical protein